MEDCEPEFLPWLLSGHTLVTFSPLPYIVAFKQLHFCNLPSLLSGLQPELTFQSLEE